MENMLQPFHFADIHSSFPMHFEQTFMNGNLLLTVSNQILFMTSRFLNLTSISAILE
jgi:hypothetical protein